MTPRELLTKNCIDALPESEKLPLDMAMRTWWRNFSKDGGFRLTPEGFIIFAGILEVEHWRVPSPANLKLLIELDNKLTSPYYIDTKKKELVLFGSKEAMMANLHGDIKRWLELLQHRNVKKTTFDQ